MFSSKSLTALCASFLLVISSSSLHAGDELIDNGGFNAGMKSWTLDRIDGAQGSVTAEPIEDGKMAAHVNVPEIAKEAYYVQLFQTNLSIKGGEVYHISFRARSQPGVKISVNLMLGEAPWTNLWKQDVSLTPEWQEFSFDLTPKQSSENARVTFSRLGVQAADYWFTNASLAQ